ncbi:MAG: hypothetical protein IJX27_01605, partial [Clostridia bacterium]|nr:hypothetical protein [Clostridia bacterium]
TCLDFRADYFNVTFVINVGTLFEMLASETVDSPMEADIAVTDEEFEAREGTEVIRSYDFEKITALISR